MNNTMLTVAAPLSNDSLKLSEQHTQSSDLEDMDANSESSASENSTESDDSSTTTDSDETEESKTFELAQITNAVLQLPRDLCEYSVIFREFFTEELWSQLEPEQRKQLQKELPDFSKLLEPAEAMAEQQHTIKLLFQNKLQRFGHSPLIDLHRNLETGNYRPDIKQLRRSIIKSQRREQRFRECERVGRMAKKLFISRERFLRNAYNSAPDEVPYFEKTLQKHQNQHSFLLNADTKICAVRARKRFHAEINDIKKQINLLASSDMLSADEDSLSEQLTQDWHTEEMAALKSATAFASTTDKCIYDTFFQRRRDFTDEEAMRLSQYAKRPKLTNRNFKQYLMDYKRKKFTEPNLPEYETTDIRLRDVCARAQIGGSFKRSFPLGQKPGRKPKPKSNEPPALVPIQQLEKSSLQKLQNQNLIKQQQQQQKPEQIITQNRTTSKVMTISNSTTTNTLIDNDGDGGDGIELQQEEVETSIPAYVVSNEAKPPLLKTIINQPLPKLEPIIQRVAQMKDKTQTTTPSELIQETHSSFFALIRDFFCATPNHRMKFDELKQRIQIWLNNPITALNDWYAQAGNWSSLLATAIKFLAGDYVEQPEEYVPYIEYKSQQNIYQWIGAGRDSDARLITLCNYWLEHRKELHVAKPPISPLQIQQQQQQQQQQIKAIQSINELNQMETVSTQSSPLPPPAPRFPTKWTVRAATAEEILEFRRQERQRFEQPHRAYTYRLHGYESIVGPVRGIYTQSLAFTKARGHSMMVDERPNFVTILTLVRDATARLPNGEGTRADISELLKSSQYINPQVAENVMQTIVSGALDRLHTESDACVRYDSKRKIWIYLHRNRSEAEFERMHQSQQGQPKITKITKSAAATTTTVAAAATATIPASMVDTPQTGAILNSIRKMVPKGGVIKTITNSNNNNNANNKDNIIAGKLTMPALVPSSSSTTTTNPMLIGTQQQQQIIKTNLPKTTLPVPPLKYNIPTTTLQQHQQQQQKSLLKSTVQQHQQQQQQQQRRFIDPKTGATLLTTKNLQAINSNVVVAGKTIGYALPTAGKLVSISNANPITKLTTTTNATTTTPLTATVAGKRVSLSKPIIINQINNNKTQQQLQQQLQQQQQQQLHQQQQQHTTIINQNKMKTTQIIKTTQQPHQKQQQQQTQGFIIPISAANSNSNTTKHFNNMQTIVIDPSNLGNNNNNTSEATTTSSTTIKPLPSKNIIRFVPNVKQQQQIISNNNKIIGQRLITTTTTNSGANNSNISNNKNHLTIRGATKMLTTTTPTAATHEATTTLLPNNSTIVNTIGNSGNLPGTIIKMSPQAFSALQQKQQIQHIVKTSNASAISPTLQQQQQQQQAQIQQRQQQQQRLIIGNTAIIAHSTGNNAATKKIVLQQQQQQSPVQSIAKLGTTNTIITHSKPINTSTSPTITSNNNKIQMLNATSLTPQQQRLLIQNLKQQQQQPNSLNKPLTVVVSQSPGGVTRLLKTSTAISATSPKTSTTTETVTTPNITKTVLTTNKTGGQIITLNTSSTSSSGNAANESGNGGVGGTIITQSPRIVQIAGTTQQRLITQSPTASNATNFSGTSAIRVVQSGSGNAATTNTNTGPTTFSIANIQGKQVVFATKTPANVKQITNIGQATGTGIATTAGNSVIINGQTIKLQGNNFQTLTKASGNIAAVSNASTTSQTTTTPQLQTVIMGNQILRVLPQNLIPAKAVVRSEAANNAVQNRIVTIGPSSSSSSNNNNRLTTSTTTINSVPKTLVLSSGIVGNKTSGGNTQTIRIQNASGTPQESSQTTLQKATTTTTPTGGNRVHLLSVPGGGQFILPTNFTTGNTINLKSLQNMKLVSLAQVQQHQQQQQDKSKNTTATTLAKT